MHPKGGTNINRYTHDNKFRGEKKIAQIKVKEEQNRSRGAKIRALWSIWAVTVVGARIITGPSL